MQHYSKLPGAEFNVEIYDDTHLAADHEKVIATRFGDPAFAFSIPKYRTDPLLDGMIIGAGLMAVMFATAAVIYAILLGGL